MAVTLTPPLPHPLPSFVWWWGLQMWGRRAVEGSRWERVTFRTGRRVRESVLVSVFRGVCREKSGTCGVMPGVEHGTSGEPCGETFACPHSITKAYLDDVGQGEACLRELPSGFQDSLEGGDINLKMATMGAKFGSFAEWRALPNPALNSRFSSSAGALLARRAGTRCLAAEEPW